MTIIIAIKCADAIIVASDSRTTDESGRRHDDAQKLHVIEMGDGNAAILAEAGNAEQSARALEILEKKIENSTLDNYRSFTDCAEKAVAELKHIHREQYKGTSEELQRRFSDYEFSWLLAYYYDNKPYVFTLDFPLGLFQKRDQQSCAIGCGSILADFLIDGLDLSLFTSAHGMWTAVYAVEEIKKFDGRCGGKTRSALVKSDKKISIAQLGTDESLAAGVEVALEFSDEENKRWQQTVERHISLTMQRQKSRNPHISYGPPPSVGASKASTSEPLQT